MNSCLKINVLDKVLIKNTINCSSIKRQYTIDRKQEIDIPIILPVNINPAILIILATSKINIGSLDYQFVALLIKIPKLFLPTLHFSGNVCLSLSLQVPVYKSKREKGHKK